MGRYIACVLLLLLSAMSVSAQISDDQITRAPIIYDSVVEDNITAESVYDWWTFSGAAGDRIRVRMAARNGLAPLIGILDEGQNIIARSDLTAEGVLQDAEVNSMAELFFTLPEAGEYTIVATRAGNYDGDTTGDYTLSLALMENEVKDLQDVIFRCDDQWVTTAATIELGGEGDDGEYRITVYGLDGFEPYIRLDVPMNGGITECHSDGRITVGDRYTLPDLDIAGEAVGSPYAARHIISGMQETGQLTVVIASRDGKPGRYLAVIEGFAIHPAGDTDILNFRLGPLATASELLVYMLRPSDSRIDPQIRLTTLESGDEFLCDDAGRGDCAAIPPANAYQINIASDDTLIKGDRLASGVRIATGNTERVRLQFASRTETTRGNYVILMVGALPDADASLGEIDEQ